MLNGLRYQKRDLVSLRQRYKQQKRTNSNKNLFDNKPTLKKNKFNNLTVM